MDKYVGRVLDARYEVTEIIGVGGMAYVYKAYDTIDDRIVAIKILKEEYLHNEEFSRRFKNESKAIAILSHRNIVRVIDVSFADELQYIVMEYIDGITLKEYIEQQQVLQWKEVLHFIVQILHALQHAHDKGIVHQDVKPQNIMLLSDGTIKVTDFGIARFSRVAAQEQGDKAIGSVHYISPEQARAEITDEKADIYSVGVMMYEMLTGKLPFESDNAVSVAIMQMQTEAVRPTQINASIPEGLEEITMKAMQKEPIKRYQSAAEMLYDIDEFKNNPSIRFEYTYFSDAQDPSHYEAAFSRIRRAEKTPEREERRSKEKSKTASKKNLPLIPLLAGLAGAFMLILMLVFGVYFITDLLQPANSPTANVEVPDLIGKNFDKDVASDPELARNFVIKQNEEYSTEPAGTIIKQSPLPGKNVKVKHELVLYISLGEQLVEIPKIKEGDPRGEVLSKLKKAGFVATEIKQTDEDVEKDCVISIDPAPGEKVPKGSNVKVYVSSGEEPVDNVTIPDVVGRAQADAIQRLKEKGLKVSTDNIKKVNHPTYSAGYVVDIYPAAGSSVAPGTELTLTVSSGFKDVDLDIKMPSVSKALDVQVSVGGSSIYSESGVTASNVSVKLKEQKASYTVTVKLSVSGENAYQTYATFTVNGETGEVTKSDYKSFTVATTTKAPTTTTTETPTTTATEAPTTTTTMAAVDEPQVPGEE